jgi:hypothetical protein
VGCQESNLTRGKRMGEGKPLKPIARTRWKTNKTIWYLLSYTQSFWECCKIGNFFKIFL